MYIDMSINVLLFAIKNYEENMKLKNLPQGDAITLLRNAKGDAIWENIGVVWFVLISMGVPEFST